MKQYKQEPEKLGQFLKECDYECPVVFYDLPVVFHAGWSDYEENAWVAVFEFFDDLFLIDYQYCLMAENNSFIFDPREISLEEYYDLKEEWKEHGIYLDCI